MIAIGFLPGAGDVAGQEEDARRAAFLGSPASPAQAAAPPAQQGRTRPPEARLAQCPRCGQATLVRQEGCDLCGNCGYSKCS